MQNKPTIGIIGFGRFGTLSSAILSRDFPLKVYHYRKSEENLKKAKILGIKLAELKEVAESDIVVLAVPISKTEEMIKKVAPLMKKGSMLVDTCSVKKLPCQWLKENAPRGIEVLGTHPMFGPVTTKFDLKKKSWDLSNKQIVLCPLTKTAKINAIKKYLKQLGIEVIVTSPDDHDKQNAKTLGLVHFLGRSLSKAGIGKQKIFTPGYADVLKILPHTNRDDWQLFYDMHNFNPYAQKIRKDFLGACEEIEDKIIKSNSADNFSLQRKLIDDIDQKLFSLLEKRLKCAEQIGKIKKKKGLKTIDPKRERDIIKRQQKDSNLPDDFIKNIYKILFRESYKKQ